MPKATPSKSSKAKSGKTSRARKPRSAALQKSSARSASSASSASAAPARRAKGSKKDEKPAESKAFRAQIEARQLALSAAEQALLEATRENGDLQAALGGAQQDLAARRDENRALREALESSHELLSTHERQSASLSATLSAKQGELADREIERKALETSVASARRTLAARDREIARLRSSLAERPRTTPAQEAENATLRERLAAAERTQIARHEEIAAFEASLAAARETIASRDAEIAALEKSASLAQETLATRDREISELRHSLSMTDETLAHRSAEIEALRETLRTAEERLASRDREISRTAETLAVSRQTIAARDAELASLKRVDILADERVATREDEIGRLREALSGIRSEISELLEPSPPQVNEAGDAAGEVETATSQQLPAPGESEAEATLTPADVADAPAIQSYWRRGQIRSKLGLGGVEDVEGFFLHYLLAACREKPGESNRILSLGTGSRDLEVMLARRALDAGVRNFKLYCLSPPPSTIRDERAIAAEPSVLGHLKLMHRDIRDWEPEQPYALCLANRSLHRHRDVEAALEKIKAALAPGGVFVASTPLRESDRPDSPIAREIVAQIWQLMPERYKYNRRLEALQSRYTAVETEGPEPPQCAEILPQLMNRFHFETFVAFGNVINAFVDREIGPNFDPDSERDRKFIDHVAALDDAKIDSGVLPPTHLIAAMRCEPVQRPVVYRHWTPDFCLRRPTRSPESVAAPGDRSSAPPAALDGTSPPAPRPA